MPRRSRSKERSHRYYQKRNYYDDRSGRKEMLSPARNFGDGHRPDVCSGRKSRREHDRPTPYNHKREERNRNTFRLAREGRYSTKPTYYSKPPPSRLRNEAELLWEDGQEGLILHKRRRGEPCLYCGDDLEHTFAVNIFVPGKTKVSGEWKPNTPSAKRNQRKFFVCIYFFQELVCNTRVDKHHSIFIRTAGPKFVEYSLQTQRQQKYASRFIDCIQMGRGLGSNKK